MLLQEATFETQILKEDTGGAKSWFIQGPFLQAEVLNGNRRIYPKGMLSEKANDYDTEFVSTNRAVGELSHPDSLAINLDRITQRIEKLYEDGNNFCGRAKILNTPCGKIIQGLLEGDVRIGVSSRGSGSLKKNSRGLNEVQNDYKIIAIDNVFHPSAPDAFVQGLMEGQNMIWDQSDKDVILLESIKDDIKKTNVRRLEEAKLAALTKALTLLGTSGFRN